MRAIVTSVLIGIIFAVGHAHLFGFNNGNSLTVVKSEERVDRTKDNCFLYEIYNRIPIRCSIRNLDGDFVPHGSNCTFRELPETDELGDGLDNSMGTVEQFICNDGHWSGTDFSVGPPLNRQKRFLFGALIVGIAALVVTGGVVACAILCFPEEDHSPSFAEPCKPPEIQDNYYVAADESVVVKWTAPEASNEDEDEGKPTVIQTGGVPNGEQFKGSIDGILHKITYTAEDKKGNKGHCSFSFNVTELRCTRRQPPHNGNGTCTDLRVGKTCQYQCKPGYELDGDKVITCENVESPIWSSNVPTCKKVSCGFPPIKPANGKVECLDETYLYQSYCSIKCNTGYSLRGKSITRCQADRTWDNKEPTTCIDQTPPTLSCISPQIFYADRGVSSTTVTWKIPTATDPTDPEPNVQKISGPSLGDVISVGSDYVTYNAIDYDGNKSPVCRIEIRVQEITCGHPLDTFQSTYLDFKCSEKSYTYGVECNVSCLANHPLEGAKLITCEDNGEAVGKWEVAGNDSDPYCREISCPELDPPINGALVYDSILARPFCTMLCKIGYDIPYIDDKFNGIFFCADNAGWVPDNVPDCTEEKRNLNPRLQLPGRIHYYEGDCGTNETIAEIKKNFQSIMEDQILPKISGNCPADTSCIAKNIVIKCGEIRHERRKKSTDPIKKKRRSIENVQHTRQKRQAESATLVVEFDIVVTVTVPEGETIFSQEDYYDNIITELSSAVQELLKNDSLELENFTTRNDSWEAPYYAAFVCDTGYVLDGAICKPCPFGHYLNETANTCDQCPIGQYGRAESSVDCISCPTGYSTKQTGSESLDNCTELCGPGTISPDGMMPCSTCQYGEYQDDVGQTTCKQCPRGTTTQTTNSTSSQDCQNYDALIEETSGPISLANISSNMTLLFWTKRADAQAIAATILLKSDGYDRFILYLTDKFRVQIPNQIPETIVELSSDKWIHQAVVWNTGDNTLHVYIDGDMKFTSALSSSSFFITNGELTLTASGQSGLYMTGFYLYDRVLTALDITTHASSCHVTSNNDAIDNGIFQDNIANGISVVAPSKCDAVDNCQPDPCNGHHCVDDQDTFTCFCNSGWSGSTCLTPPDYCTDNQCTNGATCKSGVSDYTCDCLQGYSGYMCEIAPVDGGWSEWYITSACSHRCGTGSQTRARSCDSPVPDLYGADCDGDDKDTILCNTEACQVCEDLPTKSGTLTSCMTNITTDIRTCEMYCEEFKIIPLGLPEYQNYECGPHTNYTWENAEILPILCVEPSAPTHLEIQTSIECTSNINDSDVINLTDLILDYIQSTPCADHCQTSVQLSNTNGTTLTLSYGIDLSLGPELHIDEYFADGTVSESLQELANAINYLELTAQHLQNNTADIFDVIVDGVPYTAYTCSITAEGFVTCPDGQIVFEGACLKCPIGTYFNGDSCTFCEMGTYQPSSGQSECIHCPSTLTTKSIGSTNLSECSEWLILTTSTTMPTSTEIEPTLNTTVIVSVVLSIVALVMASLVVALVWYKQKKCRSKNQQKQRQAINEVSNTSNSRPTTPSDINLSTISYQCTGSDELL